MLTGGWGIVQWCPELPRGPVGLLVGRGPCLLEIAATPQPPVVLRIISESGEHPPRSGEGRLRTAVRSVSWRRPGLPRPAGCRGSQSISIG